MSKPRQDPLLVRARETDELSAAELVDRLCEEQRTLWLQGDAVPVETLLEQYPEVKSDPESAFELVYSEFLLRRELGKLASVEEFSRRFPEHAGRLQRQLEFHHVFESGVNSVEMFPDPAIETRHRPAAEAKTGVDQEIDQTIEGSERFSGLRRIGTGAMGFVYAAYDHVWQQTVALKTLRDVNATANYRIKQEFRVLADLSHPNLVQLFELFSIRDRYFLTMELIDGVDFVSYCRKPGTDKEPREDRFARAREVFRQLAEGLSALHQAGCLHCDVKPSNVLVTETGRVVVLDFGLAQRGDWSELLTEADSYLKGTAPFISPEQFSGSGPSVASDWYAVGVILFQVLTGRLPFGGTISEVMAAKRLGEPQAPAELASGIPEDLDSLCVGLLRRDPRARPSGEEVLRQLGRTSCKPRPWFSSTRDVGAEEHFVGREQELEQLQNSLQLVHRHRIPISHFVHGVSGVGKTSLLRRFARDLVQRNDVLVFSGRCYEQESVPFKALDSLVDEIVQYLRSVPQAQAASLLPEQTQALTQMFPVLERIQVVGRLQTTQPLPTDQQQLHQRGQKAFGDLLRRIAEQRDVVLCLDDLQWGDVDSAELLANVLFANPAPTILLVGCYRSDAPSPSSFLSTFRQRYLQANRETEFSDLRLDDLPIDQARELARRLLGVERVGSARNLDPIVRESAGNPYLIRELARFADATALETMLTSGSVEESIDEMLWARVARLPVHVRGLLELISVAGHPLQREAAIRAARVAGDHQKALAMLRTASFVRTYKTKDQVERIEPYHDRIREGIVRRIPEEIKRKHHLQLALALESGDDANAEHLALHYHAAGYSSRASEYALTAAEQAAKALAFDRAAELYQLVLETHSGSAPERGRLHRRLADVLASAGHGSEAANEYLSAERMSSARESAELQRLAAQQLLTSGRYDEGLEVLSHLLRSVGLKFPKTTLQAILRSIGLDLLIRLRLLRLREPAAGEFSPEQLNQLGICWAALQIVPYDMLRAMPFMKRFTLLALKVGEPNRLAVALAIEAVYAANPGTRGSNRSAELMNAARLFASHGTDPWSQGTVAVFEGQSEFLQGHWRRASELCSEGVRRYRTSGKAVWLESGFANNFKNISLYFLGELRELAERVPLLLDDADKRGDAYAASVFRLCYSNAVWLAADDPDRARDEIMRAMAHWPVHRHSYHQVFEPVATFNLLLYLDDGRAAWEGVNQKWPALKRCGCLRIALASTFFRNLRACSALAAVRDGADPTPLLRSAARDARKLTRTAIGMAPVLARLIRAQIAVYQGDTALALNELRTAAEEFDSLDMALYAAVARKRCGELIGGNDGYELIEGADAFMNGQNIKNAARMASMLSPVVST